MSEQIIIRVENTKDVFTIYSNFLNRLNPKTLNIIISSKKNL